MRAELERIVAAPGLSKDVFEQASRLGKGVEQALPPLPEGLRGKQRVALIPADPARDLRRDLVGGGVERGADRGGGAVGGDAGFEAAGRDLVPPALASVPS